MLKMYELVANQPAFAAPVPAAAASAVSASAVAPGELAGVGSGLVSVQAAGVPPPTVVTSRVGR
jgi:hypothetical protein